jgi:quercetin dioxygenase-like cupin family protein
MIHEDDRRILEDWPEAKIITAKQNCTLGNHYHKVKTEKFIMVSGIIFVSINGGSFFRMMKGELLTVHPGEKHTFDMSEDAVMIGICSHAYDPKDDYTV